MNTNFDIETFMNDFCTNCSKVQVKTFSKEEVITNYISNAINQYREYEKSLESALSRVNGIMPA